MIYLSLITAEKSTLFLASPINRVTAHTEFLIGWVNLHTKVLLVYFD